MLWRSSTLVVAARGEQFFVFSERGDVVASYGPKSFSDEDDLWTTSQCLEGDRLVERTTIEHGDAPARLAEEKILVSGLRPVDDEATKRLAASALAMADAAAEREELERERAAAARVAAIPRGSAELRSGPIVARAQHALIERIERWSDERAERLLRTLVKLTEAKVSAGVLQAYARGCLSACFEYDLPPLPAARPQTPNAELAAELRDRVKELERDAEGQEWADADQNAAAFWSAAKAIQWAAERLAR